MADLTLALRVKAEMDRALRETRQLKENVSGIGGSAKVAATQTQALGGAMTGVAAGASAAGGALKVFGGLAAGLGLAAVIKQTLEVTAAQEDAVAAVENALANFDGATSQTLEGLQSAASELQKITAFGDEAILDMQSVLLTFQQIDDSNFQRATAAVLDLAERMKTDLRSAALQVGKALQDPAKGLTALSRSGTTFTEEQTELIKALHETGRAAEAQGLILAELEKQYGGAAEAARNTLGGALRALGNAWGDAFEVGGPEGAQQAVEDLVETLGDPAVQEGIRTFATGIVGSLEGAVTAASTLALAIREIGVSISDTVGDLTPLEQLQERLRDLAGTNPIGSLLFSEESLRDEITRLVGVIADEGDRIGDALQESLAEYGFDVAGIITAPLEAELQEANARVIDLAVELQQTLKAIREEGANLEFIPNEDSRAAGQARLDALVTRSQELQDELQAAERRVQDIGEEIAYQRSQVEVRRVEEEAAVKQTAAKIVEVSTEAADEAAEARVEAEESANERLESIAQRHWAQVAAIASGELEKLERERERTLAEISDLEAQGADPKLVAEARLAADRIYWEERERLVQEKLDAEAAHQESYWEERERRLQERLDDEAAYREEVARRNRQALADIEREEVRLGLVDQFEAAEREAREFEELMTGLLDPAAPGFDDAKRRIEAIAAAMRDVGTDGEQLARLLVEAFGEASGAARGFERVLGGVIDVGLKSLKDTLVDIALGAEVSFKAVGDAIARALAEAVVDEAVDAAVGVVKKAVGAGDRGGSGSSGLVEAIGGLALGPALSYVADLIGIDLEQLGDDIVGAVERLIGLDDDDEQAEAAEGLEGLIDQMTSLPERFRGVYADWHAIAASAKLTVDELAAHLDDQDVGNQEFLAALVKAGVNMGDTSQEIRAAAVGFGITADNFYGTLTDLESVFDRFGADSAEFADALAEAGISQQGFEATLAKWNTDAEKFFQVVNESGSQFTAAGAIFQEAVSNWNPNLNVNVTVRFGDNDEDDFDSFHAGGVVGRRAGGARRRVSRSLFRGAPRYHQGGIAGLRPGEIPIIAREGEVIQTPEQAMQPPQISVELRNLGTPQRQVAPATLARRDRRWVIEVVTDDLAGGGDTARTLEREFGLAPALR